MLKQPLMNNDAQIGRQELIKNVTRLQQIIRSLQKSIVILGGSNDNKSLRISVNNDILEATNLVKVLQLFSNKLQNQTTDSKISKMLLDMNKIIDAFNLIKPKVQSKMNQYEVVSDIESNINDNDNEDDYKLGYQQQAQQQQQIQFRDVSIDPIEELEAKAERMEKVCLDF